MASKKRNADTQEAAWLADEDAFVLRQAYKKSQIRVKEGRPKQIDWLAVALRFVDDTRDPFDNDLAEPDFELTDPESLLDSLDHDQLRELDKDIDVFIALERHEKTALKREYWRAVRSVCRDRLEATKHGVGDARGVESVSSDASKIVKLMTYNELVTLEQQINTKLSSNLPVNTEYWHSLLRAVTLYKAKAQLKSLVDQARTSQNRSLDDKQSEKALRCVRSLGSDSGLAASGLTSSLNRPQAQLDPEPLLKVPLSCKSRPIVDENVWLSRVAQQRAAALKNGFKPSGTSDSATDVVLSAQRPSKRTRTPTESNDSRGDEDTLYANQAAQDVAEDEEVFADEAEIPNQPRRPASADGRKPRYFNRAVLGYEWNKYNQTHYDIDNPPPKVVQGYKFNIFYPDLLNKTKGPTYKIIRDDGRRRGDLSARAGEEDTCIIRFIAGPPYEDIAFRIVDREWDYSAKRERGFKSTFEGGVLQLHFQFRRMFYRK